MNVIPQICEVDLTEDLEWTRASAIDIPAQMTPELEHQLMHYVCYVCGLCMIAAQNRCIEFEGIENISNCAYNTDDAIDIPAERNSKRTLVTQCVMMRLSQTENLKVVMYWV